MVIVDIGPEQWRANIERTSELFGALPESFADREAALAFGMAFGRGEAAASSFVDDRLRAEPDGSHTWLAARSALIETVTVQRARNYWGEWEAIGIPALLVRGGTSNELRPHVTEAMRRRNPTVSFVELEGVGHNIPLLAPDRLGESIVEFWRSLA